MAKDFISLSSVAKATTRKKFFDDMHAHLICPITHEFMIDPVLAEDGNTYERSAIEKWVLLKGTSPLAPSQKLDMSKLIFNRSILATTTSLVEFGGCDAKLAHGWEEAKKKADDESRQVARKERLELELAEKHFDEGRILEAATLGLPRAQGKMAGRYFHGADGCTKDRSECYFWAKKAAEGGNEEGQHYLGLAYHDGQGTTRDYAEALKCYELAASSPTKYTFGFTCSNIGSIYDEGGFGVPSDYSKSASWNLKGAEAGNSKAQHQLARLYKDGRGVTKNLAAARSWFQKSAAHKYPIAMFELGNMEINGEGGSAQFSNGIRLIGESAELGSSVAIAALKQMSNSP